MALERIRRKLCLIAWVMELLDLVDSVLCLPDRQTQFLGKGFEEIEITEALY